MTSENNNNTLDTLRQEARSKQIIGNNSIKFNKAPLFSPHSRPYYIFSVGITLVTGVYLVLYADFDQKDHCFIPIRRWYKSKMDSFWTLSDKEKKELKEQGKI
ncbi:16871_t:CDS:2 [Entrophospora sp. SA101]|nr:11585_t:CDS:2 [Entrophospora sp. SA101]CAJ0646499.1 27_t:CDS:2 [Entrophospora sp. SA101]CAJ0646516.1 5116_t:CDS:2 [Entrophospora sp. SA101]CAJ0744936.1 14359_t:CDS:2 [Entrophospora sp. SA101]CAJ0747120.1 4055_t:CDS:2 [Entrophospora sp. SA101]